MLPKGERTTRATRVLTMLLRPFPLSFHRRCRRFSSLLSPTFPAFSPWLSPTFCLFLSATFPTFCHFLFPTLCHFLFPTFRISFSFLFFTSPIHDVAFRCRRRFVSFCLFPSFLFAVFLYFSLLAFSIFFAVFRCDYASL